MAKNPLAPPSPGETLGVPGYNPAQGPPSWYADGSGTAATLEILAEQTRAFQDFLVSGGLARRVPGTDTITNTVPFGPGLPTPAMYRQAAGIAVNRFAITRNADGSWRTVDGDYPVVQNPDGTWRTVHGDIPFTPAGPGEQSTDPRGVVNGPVPPGEKPYLALKPGQPGGPPATSSSSSSSGCPAGFQPVRQRNGKITCIQGGLPPVNLPGLGGGMPGLSGDYSPVNFIGTGMGRDQFGIWAAGGGEQFNSFNLGETLGNFGTGGGCDLISNPVAKAACLAIARGLGGGADPRASSSSPPQQTYSPVPFVPQIPPQQVPPPAPVPGWRGTVQRILPGGASGYIGGSVQPMQVSTTTLRCPARYALAIDNICYPKSMIPKSMRKWIPPRKPLLSAMDGKILQRAKSVQKKLRRVTGKLAPAKRACGPKRKRR